MNISNDDVGLQDLVQSHLTKHGMTQRHFAEKCGITPIQMTNWLKCRCLLPPIQIANVNKILKAYENVNI